VRNIIISLRDFKRAALAAMAVGVAAIYGAAIAYPVDRPERAAHDWVALPEIEFGTERAAAFDDLMLDVASAGDLRETFAQADYVLRGIRHGDARVPRLFVADMPEDFDTRMVVDQRKRDFIRTVLPLVLKANEEVHAERRRLVAIEEQIASGRDISADVQVWLDEIAAKYNTAPGDISTLLRRVDAVSPTLALSQAIEESGWGRSRFARLGNALFGQRAWASGAGFVPARRADGERFEVRAFPSLLDSVRSYVLNLNRHHAYQDYRVARAEMRARDTHLDGRELARTLVNYSERREAYVEALLNLIETNALDQFEAARLDTDPVDLESLQLAAR
jgi:Bax protein